jgi:hypothetical protein
MFMPYIAYFTGPKRFAALAFTPGPDMAVPFAFHEGKKSGVLPASANLLMYRDAYMYVMLGDLTNQDAIEPNRWDVVVYTPDQPMFWELLSGNASAYEINISQDFMKEMAGWAAAQTDAFLVFVEHADSLPPHVLPDIGVLDPVIAAAEKIQAVARGVQQTRH